MAESVDASVSNTDGAIRAGSTPAPGTELENFLVRLSNFFWVAATFPIISTDFDYAMVLCYGIMLWYRWCRWCRWQQQDYREDIAQGGNASGCYCQCA